MGNRAAVDLTKGQLTEDEFVAVSLVMEELVQTRGWAYIIQLVAQSRYAITEMIHDPAVSKEYLSGLLKAVATIPDNVDYIVTKGRELRKQREDERNASSAKAVLPFVKSGGSSPAI